VAPRVRVLGPVVVEWGEAELAGSTLGGARERRLLAILAAARGGTVAKDVIVDRLWDRPPRDPAASVDTAVSLLRRGLGAAAAVVETRRPGYRLACASDLSELDDAVAAGRWDEAVGLAAGELLAGDPPTDWVARQRQDLARRRVDVTVEAAKAAAAGGDDAAAVDRYRAAVRDDPLREDAHRGLMSGLARLGRSAEALRAFERCRRALREELGAEPDQETWAVYERLLAGRPPAPAGGPRPAPARPAAVPFLGRRAELARLAAPQGGCRMTVVLGDPGIGKSRLVQEATAGVQQGGMRAAACFRLLAPVPYAVLADLAPELVHPEEPSTSPAATVVAPEAGAARLAARWLEALGAGPAVLVLDDLQWADEPSLTVLGLVLRRRPAGLTVLATARDTELAPEGAASQLVELAGSLGVLERIQLGPLAPEEVMAGGYRFEDWERSGGHPLLLQERLRGGGDADLASLVLERAAAAGPDAFDLLRAAAVLGRPTPLAGLAELAGLATTAAREAALRAAAAGLLVDEGGAWRARHDVIAELVRAGLDPAALRSWHARALDQLGRAATDPAVLAHHALAAEDWAACLPHSLAAGDRALAAYANREAVDHYGRALRILDELAPDLVDPAGTAESRRRAALGRARALIVLARTDEALAQLASLPRGSGRDEVERLLVEADCGWAAWKPSQALPPARAALALARRLGDEELEGRVHAFIANPYGSLGELDRAGEHVDAALRIAERAGRPPPALVVYRLALVRHQRGEERLALEALDRCRELALAQHDERTLVFERVVRSWALGALGRYGEALAALDDVSAIGRGEEASVRSRVPNTRASLLFDLGLVDMAVDADEESLELTQGAGGAAVLEPRIHTLLNLATDHIHLGDPDRAAARLVEVDDLSPQAEYARFRYQNRYHFVRGLLALAGGDTEGALACAQTVASMAERYGAPKYRARAHLLRGSALGRHRAGAEAAVAELRAAIRVAERHGFASLAEQAHRLSAGLTGSTHHAQRARRWRVRIVSSVEGPLRARLG
jgi:DNA-binding SARP family transcriptional activator/tetratricopeptide (TPR) repeat protein